MTGEDFGKVVAVHGGGPQIKRTNITFRTKGDVIGELPIPPLFPGTPEK